MFPTDPFFIQNNVLKSLIVNEIAYLSMNNTIECYCVVIGK